MIIMVIIFDRDDTIIFPYHGLVLSVSVQQSLYQQINNNGIFI